MCYNPSLFPDKPLEAPAFVKLVFPRIPLSYTLKFNIGRSPDEYLALSGCVEFPL